MILVKHMSMLYRDAGECPSLKIFRIWLDKALSDHI